MPSTTAKVDTCFACNRREEISPIVAKVVDAEGTPGFPFCRDCLERFMAKEFRGLTILFLSSYDDFPLSSWPKQFVTWQATFEKMYEDGHIVKVGSRE